MRKLLLIFFVLLLSKISLAESSECNKEIDPKQWTNCIGTITFANGNKYVGEFKDGNVHGQGTFTWASGAKYVGEFKDGKAHVQGTWTYEDGRVEKGILKKDKLIKFATVSKMMSIEKGFDFNYFTSIYTTKAGTVYYFVYNQGYLPLEGDYYALVKRN